MKIILYGVLIMIGGVSCSWLIDANQEHLPKIEITNMSYQKDITQELSLEQGRIIFRCTGEPQLALMHGERKPGLFVLTIEDAVMSDLSSCDVIKNILEHDGYTLLCEQEPGEHPAVVIKITYDPEKHAIGYAVRRTLQGHYALCITLRNSMHLRRLEQNERPQLRVASLIKQGVIC